VCISLTFKDRQVTIVTLALYSYNFPINRARELFKTSEEATASLVRFEKTRNIRV